MKLCGTYKVDLQHKQMIQEIRFRLGDLNSFFGNAELYAKHTVIIELLKLSEANLSYTKLSAILQENTNTIIDCYDLNDFILLSKKHPYRIMYHYPCTTYNDLYRIIFCQPYAITIAEPLTFDIINVRQTINSQSEDHYINIRVLPMIGRPTEWNDLKSIDHGIQHFWIAPHLIDVYAPYIDVFDLYDMDVKREQALIEVYTSQKYMMPIGSLVKNLESSVSSEIFDVDFAKRRLSCRQTCMRGNTGCQYCMAFEKLAQVSRPINKYSLLEK